MRTSSATKSDQRAPKATELPKAEVKGLFRTVEGAQGARERRRLLERIGHALKIEALSRTPPRYSLNG